MIIEGRALQDKIAIGDKEDDLYVNMIEELVELILGKSCDAANEDDKWKAGGSVRVKNVGRGILCVYDLVKCGSSFDELRWVSDARHSVHNVSTEYFERRYSFPALLSFSDFGPRHKVEDFSSGVYK